jgi:hypothetical protein
MVAVVESLAQQVNQHFISHIDSTHALQPLSGPLQDSDDVPRVSREKVERSCFVMTRDAEGPRPAACF